MFIIFYTFNLDLIELFFCRFHESHGKHYSPSYGEGDTLGFMICLPDSKQVNHIPNTYKDRVTLYNTWLNLNLSKKKKIFF